MGRKAKFKIGDKITYTKHTDQRSLFIDRKGQYTYRNKHVVDLIDASGQIIYNRVPTSEVDHLPQPITNSILRGTSEPESAEENIAEVITPSKSLNKYQRIIKNADGQLMIVDVYDVLQAFGVTDPALQHLAKKALAVGQRGHKDEEQDLRDIKASAERAIQLYYNRHVD